MSFDPTITLGHILQLAFFLVLIVAGYFKLDKRIELVRNEIKHVWSAIEDLKKEH